MVAPGFRSAQSGLLAPQVGATARALETIWREQNIEFEDFSEGGFGVNIRSAVIESSRSTQVRQRRVAPAQIGFTQ